MDLIENKVNDLKRKALNVVSISDRDNKGIKEDTGVLGLYKAINELHADCVDSVSNSFASWLLEANGTGLCNVDTVFKGINPIKRTAKQEKHSYRDYYKTIDKKGVTTNCHEFDIRRWCQERNKGINLTEDVCTGCEKKDKRSRKEGVNSNQIEKHYCCRSYIKYPSVIGYEVSTCHSRTDGQNRNVDIVFLLDNHVYIGEAKEPNSGECLLRAVLEVETYFHRIADKQYFIDSFVELLKEPVSSELKKAILVGKNWYMEQEEKQPEVVKLMKYLDISAFDLEALEKSGDFVRLDKE